jgi:pyroglutamyl-peptidase
MVNISECFVNLMYYVIYFRYLCEFTYFTSLNIDNLRTIFIHVPMLNKPYSAADLAEGIKTVLRVLIQELRARNQDGHLNNEVCSVKIA